MMTLQQLKLVSKELFVRFEGASLLVRPKVEYLAKEAREMPVLSRQDGFVQLYTNDLVPVYKGLRAGREDNYSSLAESQPLVKSNKMSKDAMVDILSRFGTEVFDKNIIWAELLDWQPEKRTEGYKLKKGMNTVLYRNWNMDGDRIDVSKAEKIPTKWMEKSGNVTNEIVRQLGVPEDTYVYADRQYVVDNYDGLNALDWVFGSYVRPFLDSVREPRVRGYGGGALLGSKLSADRMVKNFNPSKAGTELRTSEYQSQLKELETEFESARTLYSQLGVKMTIIDERIEKLTKIKQ